MNICPPTNVPGKFKVNDVVLVHDDRHPRNMWTMGKIIETHPGRDGSLTKEPIKKDKDSGPDGTAQGKAVAGSGHPQHQYLPCMLART
ncbi:hypothetical protein AVEN_221889-1 [Araneus ventricosus]|uniref:DUF5641 domain-containing protein n=1 Tax=Araneus ventricosus TaxID=182803 RepID=A0A4Y2LQK4_ARAVE|nr:hypothetical protein AVEN_221889-1 [Araneus ventricosus]